jgi:hypothetical protein
VVRRRAPMKQARRVRYLSFTRSHSGRMHRAIAGVNDPGYNKSDCNFVTLLTFLTCVNRICVLSYRRVI